MAKSKKVIISCAVTGAIHTPSMSEYLPVTAEEVIELRNKVPREGLEAKLQNRKVIDIARDLLKISRKGLNKRSRLDSWSQDETQYLSTLEQIVDSGITPAENKLAAFRERWDFNVNSAFEEYAY